MGIRKRGLIAACILVGILLTLIYVAKFAFPHWTLSLVSTPRLSSIGAFIDARWWLHDLLKLVVGFTVLYFIVCAMSQSWRLKWLPTLLVFLMSLTIVGLGHLSPALALAFNISAPLLLTWAQNKDSKVKVIALVTFFHSVAQALTFEIRSLPLFALNTANSLAFVILTIDVFIWAGLLYFASNFKEKENGTKHTRPTYIR